MARQRDTVAVVYRDPQTKTAIRHVDLPANGLVVEVERLWGVITRCRRRLSLVRDPHVLVRGALYQLQYTRPARNLPGLSQAELIQEVGRLNAVLSRSCAALEKLKTNHDIITQVAFELRYRQTAKKRDSNRSWNSNTRRTYHDRDDQVEESSD